MYSVIVSFGVIVSLSFPISIVNGIFGAYATDAQWYAARNCGYARLGRFRMRSISKSPKSKLTIGHEI